MTIRDGMSKTELLIHAIHDLRTTITLGICDIRVEKIIDQLDIILSDTRKKEKTL